MNGAQAFNGFQFDNNSTINQKVNPVAAFKFRLFVYYRNRLLALYSQVPELKFVKKALFIRRFEQART
jgi:hypothetical protein